MTRTVRVSICATCPFIRERPTRCTAPGGPHHSIVHGATCTNTRALGCPLVDGAITVEAA